MQMVGKGQESIDLSQDKNFAAFLQHMAEWRDKRQNGHEIMLHGRLDIKSVQTNLYGVSYDSRVHAVL
jgi:hypothetical protein